MTYRDLELPELTPKLAGERGSSVLVIELRPTSLNGIEAQSHATLDNLNYSKVDVLRALLIALRSTFDYYVAELEAEVRRRGSES